MITVRMACAASAGQRRSSKVRLDHTLRPDGEAGRPSKAAATVPGWFGFDMSDSSLRCFPKPLSQASL